MSAIIYVTWQEMWRKTAFLVTIVLSVAAIALFLLFVHTQNAASYGGGLAGRYLAGVTSVIAGLYLFSFVVAYLAIFSAAGAISSEVESGLLLAILPRPVSRWQVYIGKWVAYLTWAMVYAAVLFAAVLAIARWEQHFPWHWGNVLSAFGLFELIPLILVTLTSFGSLYLSTLSNGIATSLLYSIGLIGGFLGRLEALSRHLSGSPAIVFWTGMVMPADTAYHRMVYALVGGSSSTGLLMQNFLGPFGTSSAVPSGWSVLYIGVYVLVFLVLGVARFGRRDI